MATKKITTPKVNQEDITKVITEAMQSLGTTKVKTTKVKAEKTKASKEEKKASKKEETIKATAKRNKSQLIEEVVSNREVKYKYPEDITDTLSRKAWRQKVRNELNRLETTMLRIKDQDSKDFKKAKKEYDTYAKQVLKAS